MSTLIFNPKLKRQDSPLLPKLIDSKTPFSIFPSFHSSFYRKNNQLKTIPQSSLNFRQVLNHSKPIVASYTSNNNISKDSKCKINEGLENVKKSNEKVKDILENNKKFQKTVWFQTNFQWNFRPNKVKNTFHDRNDFDLVKTKLTSYSFQKNNLDLEMKFPTFVTKNTEESANAIQKKINFLKEEIKKKDVKFRKYNPRLQIRKERVVLRDLGQSAKEVHYLVYDFENDTENVLIRKSRGKSFGSDAKNKNDYGDFKKRHMKKITSTVSKNFKNKNS